MTPPLLKGLTGCAVVVPEVGEALALLAATIPKDKSSKAARVKGMDNRKIPGIILCIFIDSYLQFCFSYPSLGFNLKASFK
jgi:hypothetical protein